MAPGQPQRAQGGQAGARRQPGLQAVQRQQRRRRIGLHRAQAAALRRLGWRQRADHQRVHIHPDAHRPPPRPGAVPGRDTETQAQCRQFQHRGLDRRAEDLIGQTHRLLGVVGLAVVLHPRQFQRRALAARWRQRAGIEAGATREPQLQAPLHHVAHLVAKCRRILHRHLGQGWRVCRQGRHHGQAGQHRRQQQAGGGGQARGARPGPVPAGPQRNAASTRALGKPGFSHCCAQPWKWAVTACAS